jgi:hypothetical protein
MVHKNNTDTSCLYYFILITRLEPAKDKYIAKLV